MQIFNIYLNGQSSTTVTLKPQLLLEEIHVYF